MSLNGEGVDRCYTRCPTRSMLCTAGTIREWCWLPADRILVFYVGSQVKL
jgi:hypothetical protein